MAQQYTPSIKTLLKNIGITPGKKSLVFFITLVAITIPAEHAYNSFAVICFVVFSILSAVKHNFRPQLHFILPVLLYGLMVLSLLWTPSLKISGAALGKEAALLFIPLAFMFNRQLPNRSLTAILKNFSLAMCIYGGYLVCRAFVRYIAMGDASVFFYNELASEKISLYLSCFFSLALFFFLNKQNKTFWGHVATAFMLCMVMLLSKKSIILTDIFIIIIYYLFFTKVAVFQKLAFASAFCVAGCIFIIFGNLSDQPAEPKEAKTAPHTVTLNEALNRNTFYHNDHFSALSFRAYRARVLVEMTSKKGFFFTGSGINTSNLKVQEIAKQHNTTYSGWENVPYSKLNFHNQYMEIYADLGIFGLILVILLVIHNLVKAVKNKYFIHIAFAILMISLFLTESFLWRQKGVVFFTLFYCLFNDYKPLRQLKKTQ